jgi:hypothetical protein
MSQCVFQPVQDCKLHILPALTATHYLERANGCDQHMFPTPVRSPSFSESTGSEDPYCRPRQNYRVDLTFYRLLSYIESQVIASVCIVDLTDFAMCRLLSKPPNALATS